MTGTNQITALRRELTLVEFFLMRCWSSDMTALHTRQVTMLPSFLSCTVWAARRSRAVIDNVLSSELSAAPCQINVCYRISMIEKKNWGDTKEQKIDTWKKLWLTVRWQYEFDAPSIQWCTNYNFGSFRFSWTFLCTEPAIEWSEVKPNFWFSIFTEALLGKFEGPGSRPVLFIKKYLRRLFLGMQAHRK